MFATEHIDREGRVNTSLAGLVQRDGCYTLHLKYKVHMVNENKRITGLL